MPGRPEGPPVGLNALFLEPGHIGGTETYTRELVSEMSRRGNQVTLVSFGEIPRTEETQWMEELTDLDTAGRAKNDQGLLDAQAAMGRTCGACHTPHRERMPDGH